MEDSDVVLRLTEEEALTLGTLLTMFRTRCEQEIRSSGDLLTEYAFSLVNSEIDPIIAQLEGELEQIGAR